MSHTTDYIIERTNMAKASKYGLWWEPFEDTYRIFDASGGVHLATNTEHILITIIRTLQDIAYDRH